VLGREEPKSLLAIENLHQLGQNYLSGNYDLEIIDLDEDISVAETERITAIPTLVKDYPPPTQKFYGDLSDTSRLLQGLGIRSG